MRIMCLCRIKKAKGPMDSFAEQLQRWMMLERVPLRAECAAPGSHTES